MFIIGYYRLNQNNIMITVKRLFENVWIVELKRFKREKNKSPMNETRVLVSSQRKVNWFEQHKRGV